MSKVWPQKPVPSFYVGIQKNLEQGVDERNSDDITHVMLNINTIESIDDD